MKIVGVGICLAIIFGAILQVGYHLFLDINSALFVLGGATGFYSLKRSRQPYQKLWSRCCLFWLTGNSNWINRDYRKQIYGLG